MSVNSISDCNASKFGVQCARGEHFDPTHYDSLLDLYWTFDDDLDAVQFTLDSVI